VKKKRAHPDGLVKVPFSSIFYSNNIKFEEMIKPALSILFILILSACSESKKEPVPPTAAIVSDGIPLKKDSVLPVIGDSNIGFGLTQEELADDSVFADGSKPSSWQTAGITDVKGFKMFLKEVQQAVLNNDKEKLAKSIAYPLGKQIRNEQDFIKHYDRIFSKDAKLAIARLNFSQLFRNSKGVMCEDGKIWFSQVGDQFKIIAING
jgi:hypothetical protein